MIDRRLSVPPLPPVPLLAALPWGHLALVLGGALLGMVALWSLPIARRNAAIVDVGWAAFLGLAAVGLAAAGSGPVARRALLAGMVGLWSARLVTHLVRERLAEGVEEGRYRRLRKRWGAKADRLFLPFFLAQIQISEEDFLSFLFLSKPIGQEVYFRSP